MSKRDLYRATLAPRGNILAANGRFTAIGGTDSFTKNDTSSVTGTPPASMTGSGTLNGDMALTYSVDASADLAEMFGGTWPCVNVALSGTPNADTSVKLAGRFVSYPQSNATPMLGRALFACHARSEGRRVGKECCSKCRFRWWP